MTNSNSANSSNMMGQIMVALDYPDADSALKLVEQLKGIPCYMKVGMQLFYAAGPDFIRRLKDEGYNVFLDLKLHDIPNTVKGAAGSITQLGVDMFNVHAAGGIQMMQYAMEGVREAMSKRLHEVQPIVIAVTQLTSTSQTILNDEIGIPLTVEEAVVNYADHAKKAGLQGVVASPLEVVRIKQTCGEGFITVTPGIRPAGSDIGDQSRVMTPQKALQQGTDYIVIGRPITAAANPRLAFESIVEELS